MKALAYVEPNKIDLLDVPEPNPEKGLIKVKINYCALCATDIHIVTQNLYNRKPPYILGHEATGSIVEFGNCADTGGLRLGDKVVLSSMTPCGLCDACRRGDDCFCRHALVTQAFAEYAVVRPNALFRIPDEADELHYCLAEPCASAMRGIDLSDLRLGDTVAISGVGGIGSIILNMLYMRGAACITAIDPIPQKRELAKQLGAGHVLDPFDNDFQAKMKEITGGRGFDVFFEVSGSPKAAAVTLKNLAPKGRAMLFAVYPQDFELSVNLYRMYLKEARIQTVFTTIYNYPRVLQLIPRMQADKLIGKVMPLSQAHEAFELFKKSVFPKIVLKC